MDIEDVLAGGDVRKGEAGGTGDGPGGGALGGRDIGETAMETGEACGAIVVALDPAPGTNGAVAVRRARSSALLPPTLRPRALQRSLSCGTVHLCSSSAVGSVPELPEDASLGVDVDFCGDGADVGRAMGNPIFAGLP